MNSVDSVSAATVQLASVCTVPWIGTLTNLSKSKKVFEQSSALALGTAPPVVVVVGVGVELSAPPPTLQEQVEEQRKMLLLPPMAHQVGELLSTCLLYTSDAADD